MSRCLPRRAGHYAVLLTAWAALSLPNLGTPGLWDIDEGLNAEASREMLERGDWIVPTFNFELRTAKPALINWLQMCAYQAFGVTEWSARLPSALAVALTVLLTYELGRLLFGASTGLIGGLVLASAVAVCGASRFANPDALLLLCTTLTFLLFWQGYYPDRRRWFVPVGAAMGLGMLAKGPVGVVLPAAVIGLYLLWDRQLKRLADRRLISGGLMLLAVAAPWYAAVGVETRGAFLRVFLGNENVRRFMEPMQNHSGPVFTYLVVLLVGLAPWSVFLGPTVLAAWRVLFPHRRAVTADAERPALLPLGPLAPLARDTAADPTGENVSAYRFLACWVGVYLVFFSLAATKLPNYILPLYPAVALLTARFLDRWRTRQIEPAGWVMPTALGLLAVIGLTVGVGLVVAGGTVPLPTTKFHPLPGLERWAALGLIPIAGACVAGWYLRRRERTAALRAFAVAGVVFVAGLAAFPAVTVSEYRAPRDLVAAAGANRPGEEVRHACYAYYQPSLVFYGQRELDKFSEDAVRPYLVECPLPELVANSHKAREALQCRLPVYLFLPGPVWDRLKPFVATPHRELGRRYDLYARCEIVVVTNR